jgi:fructose-bisphosphate aldolase class II
MFSIAAAFGNVHGVYKPGNVTLSPEKLLKHQEYTKAKISSPLSRPIFLVMHGGSGSTDDEITTAVKNGVIKMNIDTDTQWSYWDGLRAFEKEKRDYLQGQIGNPDGAEKPNKKFYDPRVWIRKAEESMCARVCVSMEKLGSNGTYPKSSAAGNNQVGEKLKGFPSSVMVSVGLVVGAIASIAIAKK